MKHTTGHTRSSNEKQITILCHIRDQGPDTNIPESCLVSHKHCVCEAVEVVKVAAQIDEASPHGFPQPGGVRHDGGGRVVAEPDRGIRLLGRLEQDKL